MADTSAVTEAAGDAVRLLDSILASLDGAISMLERADEVGAGEPDPPPGWSALASRGLDLAREGCAHLDTTLARAQTAMAALAREADRG